MTQKSGSSSDAPIVDAPAAGTGTGLEISMDLDDPDLDAAIEEALAATERRARQSSRKRRNPPGLPDFDLAELGDDPERSLHIFVDETEGLDDDDDDFDFMSLDVPGAQADDDEVVHEADGTDADFDFLGLDGSAAPAPAPAAKGVTRSFDELDRELQEALEDEDEADEGDLQAEMEKLLAESFGVGEVSDDDPDLAFPDFDEESDAEILAEDDHSVLDDEELFAAGDDGSAAQPLELQEENEALRAQIVELSRALSLRDLELRTAEDRVDQLEQQLVAAARQSAGVSREFEAFRRRSERDKEELQKFAGEKTLKEFLGVFDNLERALNHAGAASQTPLGQGVEMTLGQFIAALRRCGAERVAGEPGTEFDPQFHEAVGQEYSDDVESGRICHEMQAGFTLHTRLLRASMVTVSRGPQDAAPAAPAEVPAEAAEPAEVQADAAEPAEEKPKAKATKKKATRKSKAASRKRSASSKASKAASAADKEQAEAAAAPPAAKKKSRSRKAKKPAASESGDADGEANDES